MPTDPHLVGLFDDVYAAAGHHPHGAAIRSLLQQLLANITTAGSGGTGAGGIVNVGASSIADGLTAALQPLQQHLLWGQLGSSEGGEGDASGPVAISILELFLATALVAVNGAVSLWMHLGLHYKLAVAAVRCIVQLSVLGYILVPIFVANRWWLTLLYSLFMLGVSAIEAVSRPSQTYEGMLPQVLVSLGTAASLVISYGLAVVIEVHPWYDAQYMIPMLGMLLGNACSGIAVGLSTVLDELSAGRDKVEMLLSMGASRMEAARDVIQRSVRVSMTPILNQMSVVGLVSIPGMMTGQILGGSDPATAARYQIVIMFLIGATTALATVATIYMAVLSILDDHHRLRSERLQPKAGTGKGAVAWVQAQAKRGWVGLQARSAHLATRLRLAFGAVTWRTRHRYLFRQESASGPHMYSRVGSARSGTGSGVGSGAMEEGDGEEEEGAVAAERQASLPGRMHEGWVGARDGRVGLGEGQSQSPRVPLLAGQPRGGGSE